MPRIPIAGAWTTPILAAALLGAVAGPADSATTPVPAPTVASIPAAVQPLVAKIEQLPVNSERYSETTHAAATVTVKLRNGKHRKRSTHISKEAFGEASLAPLAGKIFKKGDSGQLSAIGIGSTLYAYSASIARKDGGRPWVRFDGASAGALFPFHGGAVPRFEVSAGGTGSYAELIDLLATAAGNVSVVGPASVDGQQTTELAAVVKPLALVKGVSQKETEALSVELKVFVTESGLPVRVIRSQHFGPIALSDTTDVLAVDTPVSVKAPPASRTISAAKAMKLLPEKSKGAGKEEGGTGFKL
jgi:hypothetical protein